MKRLIAVAMLFTVEATFGQQQGPDAQLFSCLQGKGRPPEYTSWDGGKSSQKLVFDCEAKTGKQFVKTKQDFLFAVTLAQYAIAKNECQLSQGCNPELLNRIKSLIGEP